jgi:hypothetical protein
MQRHFCRQGIFFLLILAAFVCLCGCKASSPQHTTITENDVLAMISEVEKATLSKDLDGVIKHLAPFVVINVTMDTPSGTQRIQLTRDQYKEALQKTFDRLVRHEYMHQNDKITIGNGGVTAIAETDVAEVLVIDGQERRTITHERAVLEIVDGEILVVQIDGVVEHVK